jgi:hypothetical protein
MTRKTTPVRLLPAVTGTVADHVHELDSALIAAIQQAIAQNVPQAAIVGVLAGHSLVQTQRLIGQDT